MRNNGSPSADSEDVTVRLTRVELDALDRWIGKQGDSELGRADIVRTALCAWLVDHGCLRAGYDHPQPTGPATDVLHRMDADIAQDKAKRTSRRAKP